MMPRVPLPPVAVILSFIDAINAGDLDRLVALMHPDHELLIEGERPVSGRDDNRLAWEGYFAAFPDYVVYPQHIHETHEGVSILGTTTGSHLGLPDHDERQLSVIWHGTAADGLLRSWAVLDDTPTMRRRFDLPPRPVDVGRRGCS